MGTRIYLGIKLDQHDRDRACRTLYVLEEKKHIVAGHNNTQRFENLIKCELVQDLFKNPCFEISEAYTPPLNINPFDQNEGNNTSVICSLVVKPYLALSQSKIIKLWYFIVRKVFNDTKQMSPFLRVIHEEKGYEIHQTPAIMAVLNFKWQLPVPYFILSKHPLIAHKLSILRNKNTKSKQVRELLKEIGQLLCYEATLDLLTITSKTLESPLGEYTGIELNPKIGLVPILRSGLSFVEVEYYNKLPSEPNVDQVIVLDPIIATGGTAIATIGILKDWGIQSKIKFVAACASKQGIEHVSDTYPDVEIFVGAVDEVLDEQGYIVPGLGDAGDRLYNIPHA
ncbi:2737_t:CDS:2 [Diversispora eburnea]|uniref:uracil phosphoribosyltransferase n=1 Tax=Diversispora eburnea TaxID=1213867 RepID=A0A9N9F2Q2_9GLOM|nr:2737_t:CDS:2 [Diversispora eburnea]